ncbi:S46 family peptidase [Phaeocystidibacter luteus]|uniref:Dipeptidyl-peptidase n=1 Tax=Phaeocystidibacter luteus TaxID=911197 RepID=A0A6N6RJ19_9FLAO|nr:S46 family peptidase [Phaeocystidibacter luteus]KAB2813956.1 S46 family peptidase [Phaeocystidibacter luteus]
MKKFILSLATAMITLTAFAGEGMWLPMMLGRTYEDMKEHGLNLSQEELYSLNAPSLKDAIVSMGGGFCTGEIISSQGLLLTNHHCGYDFIRSHSSVDANYLRDGFWAMEKSQELPNEGLFVRFLERMDDVTPQVLEGVNDAMSEGERAEKIQANIKAIVEAQMEGKDEKFHAVQVRSFYHGNEFYMFTYKIYRDVRLVGAPPSSVGKFGGDTDNWMWPRHTGDFSMFRVYMSADGQPAEYSQDNIPLKPRHHLPISMKERNEGDYAMIFGYPGSTDRYLSSFGVQEAVELHHPAIVTVRDLKLSIMREAMDADEAVDLMLASSYASTANYWKYFLGQTEQLINNRVYDKKKEQEAQFAEWVNADPARKEKYGETLDLLKNGYAAKADFVEVDVYALEAGLTGVSSALFAYQFNRAVSQGASSDDLKAMVEEHFAETHIPTDHKLMGALFALYNKNIDEDQHPKFFTTVDTAYGDDFGRYANFVFENSMFADQNKLMNWVDNPVDSLLSSDPMMTVSTDLLTVYLTAARASQAAEADLQKGYRLWTAGIREMNSDKMYAPDANSTMRVTYGNVLPYEPRDGVYYDFYTTMEGVIQKMDNEDREFIVPDRLYELYKNKDYGQYANKAGELPVGFISNNDITGGNSGSPVINGDGELIGCAFDGNWEAMSGDIFFEKDLQRTISVDIRYVLFIVDKYAGAGHLVDEMTLVYPRKKFLGIF